LLNVKTHWDWSNVMDRATQLYVSVFVAAGARGTPDCLQLMKDAIAAAVAEEREACARLCDLRYATCAREEDAGNAIGYTRHQAFLKASELIREASNANHG
jgi:hypothetical protein